MPVFEAVRLALQTIRAQKLKSGFSLLGVFIGVASLIGAWSIVNGVNRYMTEKFAQTLFGVNTFQLRRRPMFTPNVPDSVGRAFTAQENRSGAAVAVLGDAVAQRLFADRSPLDRGVRIGGIAYRVIGVVEKQGSILGFPLDRFVVVPALSPA